MYGRTNRVRGRTNRVDTEIEERGDGVVECWSVGFVAGRAGLGGWFHLFGSLCRFTLYGSTNRVAVSTNRVDTGFLGKG